MKRILTLMVALVGAYLVYNQSADIQPGSSAAPIKPAIANPSTGKSYIDDSAIEHAWREHRSNVQLEVQARLSKLLRDDNEGSRHQRFIVALPSGHTLLVAHNIDLAGRINDLREGEAISLYGEYEWNAQGGVMHWTHRDPSGRHQAGWIKYRNQTYQ